jgi:hypothetical protein
VPLVPRESAVYREFERLYQLARTLRPTSTDRWNGDLVAGGTDNWGSVDRKSGTITLSAHHVLRHLRGSDSRGSADQQAQALATILHEATHAGMALEAPTAANAVHRNLMWNVMEGVAEVRAIADVRTFAVLAGYGQVPAPPPQYPAPYSAIDGLLQQASGPRRGRGSLLDALSRGPGALHLDELADGVLQNRLVDVVPLGDQEAVRAALIGPMLHPAWSHIGSMPSGIGESVAHDIQVKLNSAVDEIRQHYRAQPGQVFPAERPNAGMEKVAEGNRLAALPAPDPSNRVDRAAPDAGDRLGVPSSEVGGAVRGGWTPAERGKAHVAEMRFLDGVAPAAGATARRPSLGQGARSAGQGAKGRRPESGVERE